MLRNIADKELVLDQINSHLPIIRREKSMMYFKGMPIEKIGYCKCKSTTSVTSEIEEWGYWDVCCKCGKPIEDGFHYYNHYDGEDHDDLDIY